MPSRRTTPARTVQVPDETWLPFLEFAQQHRTNASELVRQMIVSLLEQHNVVINSPGVEAESVRRAVRAVRDPGGGQRGSADPDPARKLGRKAR